MAISQIAVDDILVDIRKKGREISDEPLSTMEHVDDIIKDILEKRQQEELKKEKRELSLREKMELEEEIKVQTKTLTAQFEKLKESGDKRLIQVISDDTGKLFHDVTSVDSVHSVDTMNTVHTTNTQAAQGTNIADISNMARDFVTPIEDETPLHISPTQELEEMRSRNIASYKELKNNRNRVIDAFVLDPKNDPKKESKKQKADNIKNESAMPKEAVKVAQDAILKGGNKDYNKETEKINDTDEETFGDSNGEYEYIKKSQRDEVLMNLKATAKKVNISVVLFSILSILAIPMLFSRQSTSADSILFVGVFPISVSAYSMVNMALMIVTLMCGFSIISNAFASLAQHKPDKDILYFVAMIMTVAATAVICYKPSSLLNSGVNFYVPVLILLLLMNFISKKRTLSRIIESFNRISDDEPLYAATSVSDRKAVDGLMSGVDSMGETMLLRNVKTGFIQNFLAHSLNSDKSDMMAQRMAAASLPLALIIFAIAFIWSKNVYLATSLAGGSTLLLIGFITPILVAFPLSDSADLIRHFAGVMPDYDAIDCFCETDAVMLDATDLFNESSILLHGIKTFQGKRIDTAIVEAASIVTTANSVLKSVFMSIIANDTTQLKPVDSIVYEDSMGVSGWVNEKRVLIGNRALMINHSIAVPKEEYEVKYKEQGQELIYLSSEGELCAAFVLEFTRGDDAADLIDLLVKNNVTMIIKSVDSCVTTQLVEKVFSLEPGTVKILPSHLHRVYDEQMEPLSMTDGAMANDGTAFSMAVLVAAAKKLIGCINFGAIMQYVAAGCGVALLLASLLLKLPTLAGALQLTLFMALFAFVYWIFEKNVKL